MLKKTISKILAVAMLVSALGNISILSTVNAEETQVSTKDVWVDFEDMENIPTSGTYYVHTKNLNSNTTAVAEIKTMEDGNNVLHIQRLADGGNGHNTRYFKVNIDSAASKETKVVIKYDMMWQSDKMPDETTANTLRSDIYYNSKTDGEPLAVMMKNWISLNNGKAGTNKDTQNPAINEWYHVEHTFDIKNGKINGKITKKADGDNATAILTVDTSDQNIKELNAITLNSAGAQGDCYFDNISVDYVYDVPNPEVEVYAGTTKQENLSEVSEEIDNIKVNFNAQMDSTTVTKENVYVINKLTEEKVGATLSYADGVATLALSNDLQKGATYQVVITKDAKNGEGIGAGIDKTYDFTVSNAIAEDEKTQKIEIDFEDMTTADIATADGTDISYYLDNSKVNQNTTAVAEIVNLNGNNVIKLQSSADGGAGYNKRVLKVKIDSEASKKAKVVIKYDMMTDDATSKSLRTDLNYKGGSGYATACMLTSTWKNLHNGIGGTAGDPSIPAMSEWYHVEHEFDIKNGKFTGIVTDSEGNVVLRADRYNDTITELNSIDINSKSHTGMCYYDNIEVSYVYAEPEVNADSVKLYADGVLQADKKAVSILTNSMTVDFGTAMDVNTLGNNNFYVTNKATGTKVASTFVGCANGVAEIKFVENLAKNATYIVNITADVKSADNLSVKDYAPIEFTVAGESALPSVNFGENVKLDFTDMVTSDIPTANGTDISYYLDNSKVNQNTTAVAEIVNLNGNNVINLQSSSDGGAGYNKRVLKMKIDSEASKKAKVVIKYDMMTDDETNKSLRTDLNYNGGTGYGTATLLSSSWKNLHNGIGGTAGNANIPAMGEWYHAEHTFDLKNSKISGVLTDSEGNVILTADRYENTITELNSIDINSKSHVGNCYYDNIEVSYIYDTPTVTADSLALINTEGAEQDNWNNISLLTKAVKVDFGTVMDTATLTNENVYLENKATGDKVDAVLGYSDGVLTLNLTEKLLAKSVYKLVINENVANVNGVKLENYIALEFTTGESKRTAVLTGVYNGTAKVTEFSGLKAGDTVTINVSYANSTSDAQTVNIIIAYYEGDALEKTELVSTENIPASISAMNYTYNHMVADLTNITKVKVFSWDSLSNLIPLSKSIVLD